MLDELEKKYDELEKIWKPIAATGDQGEMDRNKAIETQKDDAEKAFNEQKSKYDLAEKDLVNKNDALNLVKPHFNSSKI
jgi:hypothetical protein